MRYRIGLVALAVCLVALPGVVQAQFFSENFDSYVPGSTIQGQGGWDTWGSDPGANTIVTNAQSNSPSNSLLVAGTADIVHTFDGATTGTWYAKTFTYVPTGQLGDMYFIILNIYDGDPTCPTCNWSVQIRMSASDGVVQSLGGSGNPSAQPVLPLLINQWVEIVCEINIDLNQVTIFYNGVQLDQTDYQGGGANEIDAFDLFSDGSSESYQDDVWLDTSIPVELQSFDAE